MGHVAGDDDAVGVRLVSFDMFQALAEIIGGIEPEYWLGVDVNIGNMDDFHAATREMDLPLHRPCQYQIHDGPVKG